jgi:hypothetical protein
LAVDADDVATTEFDISKAKKQLLIANGRAKAKRFLDEFDPAGYENTFHAELAPTAPS